MRSPGFKITYGIRTTIIRNDVGRKGINNKGSERYYHMYINIVLLLRTLWLFRIWGISYLHLVVTFQNQFEIDGNEDATRDINT